MERYIEPDRIANAIMMDTTFNGYYLIVEGPKDYKLYSKFINNSNVKIKEAFGFDKVKMALQLLTERDFLKKIGIIDADFSRILVITNNTDELFITDSHDAEVMMYKTRALSTILRTFVSHKKITDFEKTKSKSISETLFELGAEIGLLKLANKIHDLGLLFKPKDLDGNQISYKDFICKDDLSFCGGRIMINTIINYSRNKSNNLKSENEIVQKLSEVSVNKYVLDDLVNGHDLSNILFILLKKTLSSSHKMLHDFNSIEDCLILAYEYEDFKTTQLFIDINTFGCKNGIVIWR